jgi:hypothetical protein
VLAFDVNELDVREGAEFSAATYSNILTAY